MVNNNTLGIGTHAGIVIRRNGTTLIYDPSGHYMNDSGVRGGAGTVSDAEGASLRSYILYQMDDGPDVYLFKFNTTAEEERVIMDRIEEVGDPRGFNCARSVSRVLAGIAQFRSISETRFPSSLFNQLVEIRANEIKAKKKGAGK